MRSVTIISRYNVISSRWSSHFWVKMYVFSSFSTIKAELVKKWCKVLFYVLFYISSTENYQFSRFLPDIFSLGKIQDSDQIWWRHRPLRRHTKYTSSCWQDQKLCTEGTTAGVWICVYVRPRVNPLVKMRSPSLGWQFKSLSQDQFNKTFTSVFYKNNHCFSVWKP